MLFHLPTDFPRRIHVWIYTSAHKSSSDKAQQLAPPYILVLIYAYSSHPGLVGGSVDVNGA